ncbi:hypothetical protein AVEN_159426-1 [Araneus ventricosus]|uniref:Uncharacterized protein n=1 Tax=Araneus ventricosus TaxID=182803 RepID=A0A4Y2A2C5_ARAVE|nr:hypothetical protein AVEN_159426-1 [Araneus ventricosus]
MKKVQNWKLHQVTPLHDTDNHKGHTPVVPGLSESLNNQRHDSSREERPSHRTETTNSGHQREGATAPVTASAGSRSKQLECPTGFPKTRRNTVLPTFTYWHFFFSGSASQEVQLADWDSSSADNQVHGFSSVNSVSIQLVHVKKLRGYGVNR